jgi:hypothetical protein
MRAREGGVVEREEPGVAKVLKGIGSGLRRTKWSDLVAMGALEEET